MGSLIGIVLPACAQSTQYKEYPQNLGTYQPLVSPFVPSWMTLDMDLRARTEAQTAINYADGNAQVYELTRIRGGVEVRPTKFLTGYIQFHDNHALGLPLKFVAANMRDSFDARQAFLEFHTKTVKVFAGRQELKFGGERLIGISDFTNNSRTFDGFDARIGDKNRVDIFSTSVVAIHPTSLDKHGAGLTFHGVYGTLGTIVPHTTVEPFVFVKALPRVLSQQSIYGSETEVTFGSEVVGNIKGGFDYDLLGALQRGSYSNDSIHAGAGYAKVAYTATNLYWKPRLGGEYDYATGNPHRNLNRISTFDEQYPSNHNAFGLVDLFGYQNIKQSRINLDLSPMRHLTVLVQQEFLNVASVHDGVYNGAGTQFVKPSAQGFASDDIGKGFDASAKYVFHDYLVINIGVGHFFPGRLMTANAHGAPLTLSYLSFTYRFKVNNK
jgi:Alginate export